jgi:hypothetical protein
MTYFPCASVAAALLALGCSTELADRSVNQRAGDTAAPAPNPAGDTAVDAGHGGEPQSSPSPAADAGAPGSTPSVAADGGAELQPGLPRCGDAPYQLVRVGARDMMGASDTAHLAGVAITLSHCPDEHFVTGADGRLMLMVSRNATTWIRFQSPGHVPWLVGELMIDDTLPPVPLMATMIPTTLAAAVVPGLRADGGLVYVEVEMGPATGPAACRSPEGVTISVKDRPEASVLYRAAGSNAGYARAVMTSDEGVALIVGLPPTGSVELVASKPGCEYRLAYGNVNSRQLTPIARTPLAAGTITHQVFNPIR